jgi:ATP-dependent helicase/nuclease subunit A
VRLVSPSDSDDDDARPHRPADPVAARLARRRGTVIHRLLQSLPDLPAGFREASARAYLDRAGSDWTADQREALLRPVLAILGDARFAPLFAPGSRAEVPIVGNLPGIRVNGQIDRLAVTATEVLIADYKTGRPRPQPVAYIRQLALYRAVLARLYPHHIIRAALIWADVPDLAEISGAAMDAALARTLAQLTSA